MCGFPIGSLRFQWTCTSGRSRDHVCLQRKGYCACASLSTVRRCVHTLPANFTSSQTGERRPLHHVNVALNDAIGSCRLQRMSRCNLNSLIYSQWNADFYACHMALTRHIAAGIQPTQSSWDHFCALACSSSAAAPANCQCYSVKIRTSTDCQSYDKLFMRGFQNVWYNFGVQKKSF